MKFKKCKLLLLLIITLITGFLSLSYSQDEYLGFGVNIKISPQSSYQNASISLTNITFIGPKGTITPSCPPGNGICVGPMTPTGGGNYAFSITYWQSLGGTITATMTFNIYYKNQFYNTCQVSLSFISPNTTPSSISVMNGPCGVYFDPSEGAFQLYAYVPNL